MGEALIIEPADDPATQPTVLVVDDSRAQRHLLGKTLRRAGYQVVEAPDAIKALEICAEQEVELIISDWSMPGMDGPDFCRALRRMDRPYAYFILVTSQTDGSERALGLDAGADDFVTRPVNWVELRARIRAGERLLETQSQLRRQNDVLAHTLVELRALQSAIDTDLIEARKLQQSLMPAALTQLRGAQVASHLVTCGQVGGDLVGCFPLNVRKWALYSIDVSGHGIASALMTGRLSGLFSDKEPHHSIAYASDLLGNMHLLPPDKVVARINRMFLSELDTDIYFTVVLAYYDLETGEVSMCQAGHPHPIIQRADGTVETLGDGGPPVGLLRGVDYTQVTTRLNPRDRLLLCSDGLSEAFKPDGEMIGEDGLCALLAGVKTSGAHDTLIALENATKDTIHHAPFEDDVSMIMLQRDHDPFD